MKTSKLCKLAIAAIFGAQVVTATRNVSIAQTRGIAEKAYIYGYPMVQAHLTMYAFSVDKSNPQYKGPFNAPLSFARVFTPGIKLASCPEEFLHAGHALLLA